MLSWLKQKPRLTPRSQYPPEIVKAIHTMADDMTGKSSNTPEEASPEPLASFQPGQGSGAPFYAAPEIQNPVATEVPTAPSPFLDSAEAMREESMTPVVPDSEAPSPKEETQENIEATSMGSSEELVPTRLREEEYIASDEEKGLVKGIRWWPASKKWIIFGSGVVILLLGGALAWWYWQKTQVADTPSVVATGEVQTESPQISIEAQPSESGTLGDHYSTSQPNLLSFDTESVTAEAMATEFLKIARSIEQDNLREPVEFLIRDQNYNPLAFARFAYLLSLELPADLLSTLDEDFSLFFYLDQDRPRMGLKLQIKNKEAFLTSSKAEESSLPKAFAPIFLDTTTAPRSGLIFRSSLYQEQPVRYVNVDRDMNLSIDYAIREQLWFIGTSQNTLRAMLDRTHTTP